MNTTFHFEVKDSPNKLGRYPVYLRITQDRKLSRVKTSISLSKKSDWNKDAEVVRASEPNAKVWNNELKRIAESARRTSIEIEEKNGASSSSAVARKVKGETKPDYLLAYAGEFLKRLLAESKIGTWKRYGDTTNKLTSFVASRFGTGADVLFAEVDRAFVIGFIDYLQGLENSKDKSKALHHNTIVKHLRGFRALWNDARKVKKFKFESPFADGFEEMVPVKSIKGKLDVSQIAALEGMELPEGSPSWNARNAFLFSYYCAGIRVADVIQLRWMDVQGGRLKYVMSKVGKTKDLVLVSQAQAILSLYEQEGQELTDYIFPFLDSSAKYAKASVGGDKFSMKPKMKEELFRVVNAREVSINRTLKKVAERAGIKQAVTFHISRHSFAKRAKDEGTDNTAIQGLMNHSSLGITEDYMREIGNEREDEAMLKIFGNGAEDKLVEALKGLDKETLKRILAKL